MHLVLILKNSLRGGDLCVTTIIETRRLLLRKIEIDDVPVLVQLWCDPIVTEYEGGPRESSEVEKSLREDVRSGQSEIFDMWALVEKSSNRLIGHCGLTEKEVEGRQEIELTYTLAQSAWGKGYATEIASGLRDYAVSTLKVKRLIALIHPENRASARVAQKIGMRLERQIVRPGDHVRQVYAMQASQTRAL